MKHRIFPLAFVLVIFGSCKGPDSNTGRFILLPQPQIFEITGTSKLASGDIRHCYLDGDIDLSPGRFLMCNIQPMEEEFRAQLVCRVDPDAELPAEGYLLTIAGKQVNLTGNDRAGLLYGLMSLRQLLEDAAEQDVPLPECTIKDYPLLAYRAIHLDVKHHMEKKEYYYELMDWLASYKVNAIIVEAEDKIRYKRQPLVGSPDALSIDYWKELSEYALDRNIEISPLIQGLGHASFILKHDAYKNLRDDLQSDWAFNPLDPETYRVQFDLYLDAMEAMPHGQYLHIGGDEVHTTGRGSGTSAMELQLIWLDRVCSFAEEHGRTPIFWDDMPLKHAEVYAPMFNDQLSQEDVDELWARNEHRLLEFLDQFPKNCIYMRWNYQKPYTYGNEKAMEWFRTNGLQVMGATAGQTRWVLMPQNESNIDNIRFFAGASIAKDLNGLLLTLWDDDSPHFELYKRGIVAFAEYTWSGEKRTKEELKSAYRHRAFSSALSGTEHAFIDRLEGPVSFWNNALLVKEDRRSLTKTDDALYEAVIDLPDKNNRGEWSQQHQERLEKAAAVLGECELIAEKIALLKSTAIRNRYRLAVYEQVNKLVSFSMKALLVLQEYDTASDEEARSEALSRIIQLPEEFESLIAELEGVYGKTRKLVKPRDYLLDQDHHNHLANQHISFRWQYHAELLFLEKIGNEF